MKNRLTESDIVTSSGKYPERQKSPELTQEVLSNIKTLANKINALLEHIKWSEEVVVSSGFRPSAINASVKGAAAKSSHTLGMAVDIVQPKNNNKLAKAIEEAQKKDRILTKLGLWMEDPTVTVGQNTAWVHLDFKNRPDRPSRVFKP
jgi:hypothetical protein